MAIVVKYGPSASSVGSVAQLGGLGRFNERQREQALQEARFAAEQMNNQARFMAQQQQQAIENRMRGDQMAESAAQNRNTAWRQAAMDQFGAAQAQDQSRLRWAQGFADFENRREDRDLRREQFDAQQERYDRDFGLREQQFGYAQERDEAGRDLRLNLAQMQDMRLREQQEQKIRQMARVQEAKLGAGEQQQYIKLEHELAGINKMIEQAGVLGPQPAMLAQRDRLQREIDGLIDNGIATAKAGEYNQALDMEKRKAAMHWVDNGVPKQLDPKTGKWEPTEEWKIKQQQKADFFKGFKGPDGKPAIPTQADWERQERFMRGEAEPATPPGMWGVPYPSRSSPAEIQEIAKTDPETAAELQSIIQAFPGGLKTAPPDVQDYYFSLKSRAKR